MERENEEKELDVYRKKSVDKGVYEKDNFPRTIILLTDFCSN